MSPLEAYIIRIKGYTKKATPGPWKKTNDITDYGSSGKYFSVRTKSGCQIAELEGYALGHEAQSANAYLMKCARTDLPVLVGMVEKR